MKRSKKKTPARFEKSMETESDIDESDIDESDEFSAGSDGEFTAAEKKLMAKVMKNNVSEPQSDEELYGVASSDEMASDIENEEDDLPNVRAWGQNKNKYYSTDYVDRDYNNLAEHEKEKAQDEETDARDMQLRLAKALDDTDYSFDLLISKEMPSAVPEDSIGQEKVKSDLTSLSKRQKLALFHKESPEFASLVEDMKSSMTELQEKLEPFLKLVNSGLIPVCPATKLVSTKYHLTLNYVTNITFYLLLKARRRSVQEHPVVCRLVQYRQLLQQITPMWTEIVEPQVDQLLELHRQGVDIQPMCNRAQKKLLNLLTAKSDKAKNAYSNEPSTSFDASSEDATEGKLAVSGMEPLDKSKSAKRKRKEELSQIEEEEYLEAILQEKIAKAAEEETKIGEKRGINRQIEKNKGLTPRRKKEDSNPRVKNKRRYKQALIRRKGQVRTVRTETTRYGGELSGIKTYLRKGTKITV